MNQSNATWENKGKFVGGSGFKNILNNIFCSIIVKKNNQLNIAPFDASDYLDSEETIAEYLSAALENSDTDAFWVAVRDVAKSRGISTVAANAGLGRESLYKDAMIKI